MALKIPSINNIIRHLIMVLTRFPLECLIAFSGTLSAIQLINAQQDDSVFIRILMCCTLGLPYLLAINLYVSNGQKYGTKILLAQVAFGLMLFGYFFTLHPILSDLDLIRYWVLNIIAHLLVAVAPFIHKRNVDPFWHYNKILFIRILTSGVYSAVLFAGLAGAIASVEALFEIDLDNEIYPKLWMVVAGLFNTVFFLGGVPQQPHDCDTHSDYPKGLKMFTQYVLVPLVIVYLLILLSYELKILVTFNLPKGWISWLILAFSVVGILANLLVFPLRNSSENKWIRLFSRWFYIILVPLLGLFYWAILYRIGQYGITEERYYVFLLALWLTFICGYFIFSTDKNILYIPLSLAVLGLISLVGPQSAPSVSLKSQLTRMEKALATDSVKESKVMQAEISRILDYCVETHGIQSVKPIFGNLADSLYSDTFDHSLRRNYAYGPLELLMQSKGLTYYSKNNNPDAHLYFTIHNQTASTLSLNGYETLLEWSANKKETLTLNSDQLFIEADDSKLKISINNQTPSIIYHQNFIRLMMESLSPEDKAAIETKSDRIKYGTVFIPFEKLTFPIKLNQGYEALIVYQSLGIEQDNDEKVTLNNLNGILLLRKLK